MKSHKGCLILVDDNILVKSVVIEQRDCIIGRADGCDFVLAGKEVSRNHARVSFKGGRFVIKDLKSANGTFVNGNRVNCAVLKHGDEITISDFTIIFDDGQGIKGVRDGTQVETPGEETKSLVAHYESLIKKVRKREVANELKKYHRRVLKGRKKLVNLVNQDRLTGLYNRHFFDKVFIERMATARANSSPLSLIFIDLDYFKKINDTFGHDKGDEALKVTARIIRSVLRQDDVVARYGGEEFVALFFNMTSDNAFVAAESLRRIIEKLSSKTLGFRMTVSIGVANYPEDARTCGELIKTADQALYRAKSLGRNCVVKSNA